jgi:transposase
LRERLAAYPALTARRLFREIKERGFSGGYSVVRDRVRDIRPRSAGYEVRFETPPGEQAQVDFARFEVEFVDEPGIKRIVWLFSMVLGYSRLIWARFVLHQDLQSVLRCHIAALEAIGGAPRTILYDRMKTAVIGEDADGLVVYNRALVDLARHYGFQPRACRPYRAKTKGKVERPFRYIREDFFLGGVFRNLDDLNDQLRHWLDTVANPRVHATTQRVVNEAFAEEKASLKALPCAPYRAVLRLERRASHEGMVSVGGNLYSVPDTTRRRVFDVHVLADEVRIFEDGALVATHAPLEGRGEKRLDPAHRKPGSFSRRRPSSSEPATLTRAGDHAPRRSLDFYAAVGRRLAALGGLK